MLHHAESPEKSQYKMAGPPFYIHIPIALNPRLFRPPSPIFINFEIAER